MKFDNIPGNLHEQTRRLIDTGNTCSSFFFSFWMRGNNLIQFVAKRDPTQTVSVSLKDLYALARYNLNLVMKSPYHKTWYQAKRAIETILWWPYLVLNQLCKDESIIGETREIQSWQFDISHAVNITHSLPIIFCLPWYHYGYYEGSSYRLLSPGRHPLVNLSGKSPLTLDLPWCKQL